jgi:hypothetical protein
LPETASENDGFERSCEFVCPAVDPIDWLAALCESLADVPEFSLAIDAQDDPVDLWEDTEVAPLTGFKGLSDFGSDFSGFFKPSEGIRLAFEDSLFPLIFPLTWSAQEWTKVGDEDLVSARAFGAHVERPDGFEALMSVALFPDAMA